MALNIISGSKLYISTAAVTYKDTVQLSDFSGVSWVEISNLVELGALDVDGGVVSQEVISSGVTQYRRSIKGFSAMENAVLPDRSDPGQQKFDAAAASCKPYAFKIERGTDCAESATVTISNGSPGVVTWTSHGLVAGTTVKFSTTGTLPTGLVAGTTYYVISGGLTANSFSVSATPGGSAVNTSGAGSGTHTATAQAVSSIELLFGLALPGGPAGGSASAVVTKPIRVQPIAEFVSQ